MANLMDKYAVPDLEKLNNPAVEIVLERYRESEAAFKNSVAIINNHDFGKDFRAMVKRHLPSQIDVGTELAALVRQLHYTLCHNPTKWTEEDIRGAIERLKSVHAGEEAIDSAIADAGWTRNELGECRESY
jgi:hypothetical protein